MNTDELRKAAEAATPTNTVIYPSVIVTTGDRMMLHQVAVPVARTVVAVEGQTILALLDAHDALQAIAERMAEWTAAVKDAGAYDPKDPDAKMAAWVQSTAAPALERLAEL